jgi:hypothetical protein
MQLTKVNLLGPWFINRFKDSEGNGVIEETTEEAYKALAESGAEQPTKEGCTWLCSSETLKFDTATGKLSEGEYADDPNGGYWVYDPKFWFTHVDFI